MRLHAGWALVRLPVEACDRQARRLSDLRGPRRKLFRRCEGTRLMRRIFLVRHGVVNYDTLALSAVGQQYARGLPSLLPEPVHFIASDEESRCVETITPLARARNLTPRTYDKQSFTRAQPLADAPAEGVSVLCYRIESIVGILQQLGIPMFAHRDDSYAVILECVQDGGHVTHRSIPTGQSRPARG